jgi:hypothetical protein
VTFSSEEANEQVNGVPGGARRRVVGRIPTLAYYHQMYNSGKVIRLEEPGTFNLFSRSLSLIP